MRVLRILGLVLLSIILFFSLTAMGFAYTVHEIALNPRFITGFIDEMDFANIARETMQSQSGPGEDKSFPPEIQDAVVKALETAQPTIKKSIDVAVSDFYNYMLGKSNAPNLKGTLRDSFLNTQFLDSVLQGIDLQQITDQFIRQQTDGGSDPAKQALQNSIVTTVGKIQPALKKQIIAAADPVFKYLLSDAGAIDLKSTVRGTLLSQDFLTEVINNLDLKPLTKDMVGNQINAQLPSGVRLTSNETDQIVAALEPPLKQGLVASAGPLADYLVGIRPNFTIHISTDSVRNTTVKSIVKQAFMRQLPPELLGQPQGVVDAAFDVYWLSALSSIPPGFDLDSSMFGQGVSQSFNDALVSMQNGLSDARDSIGSAEADLAVSLRPARNYIHIFQLTYIGLIILLVILAGLIVLIAHSVRSATRTLGITMTIYGAINFPAILIARSVLLRPEFLAKRLPGDMPQFARDLAADAALRVTQPYFIFTLVCLIIGVALLIVFFVYKPKEQKPVLAQPAPQV